MLNHFNSKPLSTQNFSDNTKMATIKHVKALTGTLNMYNNIIVKDIPNISVPDFSLLLRDSLA